MGLNPRNPHRRRHCVCHRPRWFHRSRRHRRWCFLGHWSLLHRGRLRLETRPWRRPTNQTGLIQEWPLPHTVNDTESEIVRLFSKKYCERTTLQGKSNGRETEVKQNRNHCERKEISVHGSYTHYEMPFPAKFPLRINSATSKSPRKARSHDRDLEKKNGCAGRRKLPADDFPSRWQAWACRHFVFSTPTKRTDSHYRFLLCRTKCVPQFDADR